MARFFVYTNDDPDDGFYVEAFDASDAAETWAEQYDQYGDYDIVRGHEATVIVVDGEGDERRFVVTGESVPEYHASEARRYRVLARSFCEKCFFQGEFRDVRDSFFAPDLDWEYKALETMSKEHDENSCDGELKISSLGKGWIA